MHDETAYKDRAPFDVTTIDEGISALINDGTRPVSRTSLRRAISERDQPKTEPPPVDLTAVDTPPAEEGAPVAGRAVEDILAERSKTHGDFTDNARVMQSLKRIVHSEAGWDRLTDVQREALHMILHKVGRIISGNPNIHDHWDDIAGYAKLTSERIES